MHLVGRIQTKQQFLDAIADILEEEGHEGLGVNKVAKRAVRTKELLYRYFGNFEGLMAEFVAENDYWMNCLGGIDTQRLAGPENRDRLKEVIVAVLQNQFIDFYEEPVLRALVAQSIDREPDPMKHRFSDCREREGERLLKLTDELFANAEMPFRGIAAVLVAGIDGLALHGNNNRSTVCGLDVNARETQEQILQMIDRVMGKVFETRDTE